MAVCCSPPGSDPGISWSSAASGPGCTRAPMVLGRSGPDGILARLFPWSPTMRLIRGLHNLRPRIGGAWPPSATSTGCTWDTARSSSACSPRAARWACRDGDHLRTPAHGVLRPGCRPRRASHGCGRSSRPCGNAGSSGSCCWSSGPGWPPWRPGLRAGAAARRPRRALPAGRGRFPLRPRPRRRLCASAHPWGGTPRTGDFGSRTCTPSPMAEERVSSTRVREALARGDLEQARHLLGRPYRMQGRVGHGDKRGRTIGFPTANIDLHRRVIPLRGSLCGAGARGLAERPGPGWPTSAPAPRWMAMQLPAGGPPVRLRWGHLRPAPGGRVQAQAARRETIRLLR